MSVVCLFGTGDTENIKTMKKNILFIALLLGTFLFTACGGDSGPGSEPSKPTPTSTAVTGVSINKSTLSLMEGGSETVSATVSPSSAVNKNITWSSSDSSIASIDSSGNISAKKPGTVTITVTTADGNKTATLTLTVTLDYITRQKKVLVALYDALKGDAWIKNDGWKKVDGNHIIAIHREAIPIP